MDVAVIQIGNSDDKLTQERWSQFVSEVHDFIIGWGYPIYFHGVSIGSAPWQNACWVFDVSEIFEQVSAIEILRHELARMCFMYNQDSIALTLGDTEFVKGE
jgi:hypothetical protein